MPLPEGFLRRARQSPGYSIWRVWREREQLGRFHELMGRVAACTSRYEEGAARAALESKSGQRRVPAAGSKPRVAAFGTRDWEDLGLWQALERSSDFSLFDYRASPLTGRASERRRRLGTMFLEHLDRSGAPDLVFIYASGEHLDPAMLDELHARRIWSVLMSLDDKQQLVSVSTDDLADWQIEAARHVDLYWTTWRAGADWLAGEGVTPWYAPEAADPDIFAAGSGPFDIDVLWIGRAYGRRLELIRYLRKDGFRVHTAGPGWPGGLIPFAEMIRLMHRSRVVLGMGGVGQSDRIKHLKGRDFEVPMTGAVYLTSFNPELSDSFAVGSEILCYSSFEECSEVLSWILRRPEEAEAIRRRARARARADHTWDRRIDSMLSLFPFRT